MQIVLKHTLRPQKALTALQKRLSERVRAGPRVRAHQKIGTRLTDRRGQYPQRLLRQRLGLLQPHHIDAKQTLNRLNVAAQTTEDELTTTLVPNPIPRDLKSRYLQIRYLRRHQRVNRLRNRVLKLTTAENPLALDGLQNAHGGHRDTLARPPTPHRNAKSLVRLQQWPKGRRNINIHGAAGFATLLSLLSLLSLESVVVSPWVL